MPALTDLPPELRNLIDRVPDVATVRARIEQNKRAALFLRRLLKLAVDAERAAQSPDCAKQTRA